MALKDLLQLPSSRRKIGLSEERVMAIVPIARQYIAYWREYPDMFIDFMSQGYKEDDGEQEKETDSSRFKFYFYQRV